VALITVRYIYSACVVITTDDCTVLCDPWFYPAYDGSWVQWPKIDKPLEVCGPADYVYLSHVHPDHYDPQFLSEYLARYPEAQVIIAKQDPPLLERKLRSRGIEPIVGSIGDEQSVIYPIPNRANRGLNIDSALVVWCSGGQSIVNMNDNPYDEKQLYEITELCGYPTVALLPFVGAGPWPQCYKFDTEAAQWHAAREKKAKFLQLFKDYCSALKPNVAVPFAGQYWLHSYLVTLNPLRGMADATECIGLEYQPDAGGGLWVPADGGQSTLTIEDNGTTSWNSERRKPYDWPTVRKYLQAHYPGHDLPYRYEREIRMPLERLPLLKLLESAAKNAAPQFSGALPLVICIKTQQPSWYCLRVGSGSVREQEDVSTIAPRYEVYLDARYLFGMLTRLYNANSVRIGSLTRFRVVPQEPFDMKLYDLFGDYWDSLRV
jgi:hypothetical protein